MGWCRECGRMKAGHDAAVEGETSQRAIRGGWGGTEKHHTVRGGGEGRTVTAAAGHVGGAPRM
jgi:hypothetical protein